MEIVRGGLLYDILTSDAWGNYVSKFYNKIRGVVFESVEKIKLCHNKELGFITLKCSDCDHTEKVHLSCKNRFCSSCGKVACDNWMRKVINWSLPNIGYQHIVFTIPEQLREFLTCNREALDILFKASTQALLYLYEKRYNCRPGIITVMHTFGRDIKWNPHIHTIVTIGGLSFDNKNWNFNNFIPYCLLNKAWKYYTIKLLRQWGKDNLSNNDFIELDRLLDKLFNKKWYIRVGVRLDSLQYTVKYIGRYTKRPIIAETRLKKFNGKDVSFSFKDRDTKKEVLITLSVEEFIGKLIEHIPNKNFRMIRYSGIFASKVKNKLLLIVQNLLSDCKQKLVYFTNEALSWRERIKKFTGIDPYSCPKCSKIMNMVSLTIRTTDGFMKVINCSP